MDKGGQLPGGHDAQFRQVPGQKPAILLLATERRGQLGGGQGLGGDQSIGQVQGFALASGGNFMTGMAPPSPLPPGAALSALKVIITRRLLNSFLSCSFIAPVLTTQIVEGTAPENPH